MKNTIILIAVTIAVFLAACSSAGTGTSATKEIIVNVDGKEQKFEPKTTWAYHTAFTYSAGGESSVSSSTTIVLANFELDTSNAFISINKRKIEKPEEYKISVNFLGEKGTNQDTPIKPGDYPAEGDIFNKIRSVSISHFDDGKEVSTGLDEKSMKGNLTIKSVEGTTVNGEIDVTDGKNSVKGSFSANGHKSVK